MRPNEKMDTLLNEMAVYKTELGKGSVVSQFRRIKDIIENIPDINISDPQGNTYLMVAVMQYKADIVKLLLEAGADPNRGRKDGVRPLAVIFLQRENYFRQRKGRTDLPLRYHPLQLLPV